MGTRLTQKQENELRDYLTWELRCGELDLLYERVPYTGQTPFALPPERAKVVDEMVTNIKKIVEA